MENVIKSTQEQATAAWIGYQNQLRLEELLERLNTQNLRLEDALAEVQKLKDFVGDPSSILGNAATKHGEIAENVQVYLSNAHSAIEGLAKECTFDGVGRTAPEDYLRSGQAVQSKFLNGLKYTLNGRGNAKGILQHIKDYPDFVKNGGSYDIPKDQYEEMIRLLKLRSQSPSTLTEKELRVLRAIDSFEKDSGLRIEKDIHPSFAGYKEVQQGAVHKTIENEESSLRAEDQAQRDSAYQAGKPSLQESAKIAAVSAALEGGAAFCMSVAKKRNEGKRLADFTADDWKDVGIETGGGTLKGGIRGASVYALTNFTATPACVATALVTATFGVVSQANALHRGEITKEEFLINSEALCLEVSVSAISSLLGSVLIPVPVLGAIIGNMAGIAMFDIVKTHGLAKEEKLISQYRSSLECLNCELDAQYQALVRQLEAQLTQFGSLMEFAFDPDVNCSFPASVAFARLNGVEENKILKTKADIDTYFLS